MSGDLWLRELVSSAQRRTTSRAAAFEDVCKRLRGALSSLETEAEMRVAAFRRLFPELLPAQAYAQISALLLDEGHDDELALSTACYRLLFPEFADRLL